MKRSENYYLGFDVGTDSVGYAVTDENYHILKFNGKAMWGSRLFDEAEVAEGRRMSRTMRRRIQRRKQRIELLQELFAEEIAKIDPGFYQRLKDSMLWPEDKQEQQSYSLFHDADYSDVEFYDEFPTVYHLRSALITQNRTFDVRLVYLALHHIIKHRGHFLFAGSVENAMSFRVTFDNFKRCMRDELDIEIECTSEQELEEVLKDRQYTRKDRNARVMKLLMCDKSDRQLKALIGLICGLTVKLADLFEDETLKDMEKPAISFAAGSYDELRPLIEADLQERCFVIDTVKTMYDWSVLADILKGGEYGDQSYISIAKTASYDKHGSDLQLLKRLIRNADSQVYREFFQHSGTDNYCAYIGHTIRNGKKVKMKKCSYEDMAKKIKKILTAYYSDSDPEVSIILNELEKQTFLPLQVTKENGVIPHQVHEIELRAILERASGYLPFLLKKDETGLNVKDKIIQLFRFRIPYYVGPLNTNNNVNAWCVRRPDGDGPVTPWDFEQKIDLDASGEAFIRRMTNKCTYLVGKDVLPKNSLLYSEFMVWNEINNIKLGAEKLPVEVKKELFLVIFRGRRKVTRKMIEDFLKSEGINLADQKLTGLDLTVKSTLASYHDFRKIFGASIDQYSVQQMAEHCILWITLYGEETRMLKRVIRKHYDNTRISDEQLRKITRLHYEGWGRLSSEFLTELEGADRSTGETFTIMRALRETNDNLMQLLSQKYSFTEALQEANSMKKKQFSSITYENVMAELQASPAVKRAAWQVVLIAEEIKKIMHCAPKKIFIEMTRSEGEKRRTLSRKNQLLSLYKNIKDEERDWVKELDARAESEFRSIKLYLYYTQMGRCMYTGRPIDLSELYDATVYDRDHIYPQSKTKDDSLDNLVLVDRRVNAKKSNNVLSEDIRSNMHSFWKLLRDRELISDRKYERLMRSIPLTDEELAGFINRQLVETSQSTKIVAQVLNELNVDTEIVYVKAGTVADFRRDSLKMVKVRSLNDYHHAKDAYLNIVVGNVYHEKFTNNPLKWLSTTENREYSLNQMFNFDLTKNGRVIWKRGNQGTVVEVRAQMKKNNIQYTRYATTNKSGQNGGFFDQMLVGRDDNPGVPRKKGLDVNKYGGYKTVTPAYFALIESEDKKGKLIRTIEAVPLHLVEAFESGRASFEDYCQRVYGLKKPRVIIKEIKKDSYMVIDNYPMHLRGTTGKQLSFQGAVQLCLDEEYERYLKKIEKYIQRNAERTDKRELLQVTEKEEINKTDNLKLYRELCRKQNETIYRYRPAGQYRILSQNEEKFIKLSCEQQCIVINEILHLMQCKPLKANLSLLGGSGQAGNMQVNKNISGTGMAVLINQSVTGLFEQRIDLLTV